MQIEQYLTETPITQTAFAELIGEGQGTFSRYLNGERKIPLEVIQKVETATGSKVTFSDWMARENTKARAKAPTAPKPKRRRHTPTNGVAA